MWKSIYTKLKEKGLNPYAPGQHQGLCTEKYCVVKESSQVPFFRSNRTGYRLIDIIVFVPLASYIQVKPYVDSIKTALKELSFLRKTGNETPIITDDEVKAYTTSVEYQIIKKMEV
jgi:hypothetical protein